MQVFCGEDGRLYVPLEVSLDEKVVGEIIEPPRMHEVLGIGSPKLFNLERA